MLEVGRWGIVIKYYSAEKKYSKVPTKQSYNQMNINAENSTTYTIRRRPRMVVSMRVNLEWAGWKSSDIGDIIMTTGKHFSEMKYTYCRS